MQTLALIQGSESWHAARAKCFTASEAPAMLGLSKYMSRNELLKQKATGIVPEIDAATQRRFDAGHEAEAMARTIAEEVIGEELFQATGTLEVDGLQLLASFDGLTMDESTVWENKLWNEEFAFYLDRNDDAPDTHWPQLEQQLLISSAEKALFSVSDGTEDRSRSIWYVSRPDRRAQLIAGWKQFAKDLTDYQPAEYIPAAVAAVVKDLPAVMVQVTGAVSIVDNFSLFETALRDFIDNRLLRKPQTDQDFADLGEQIASLKKAEAALDAAETQMIAQVSSVDAMKRTKDMLHKMARDNRLVAEKLLAAEKEARKLEILNGGKEKLAALIAELNKQLGKPYMPVITADFAGKMRSLKTIASLQNAVDTEFARVKIEADQAFERIDANLKTLRELAADHTFLFSDTPQLIAKANDDLIAVIKSRIAEHKEAEQKRIDAEREKIRTEEAAKLKAEADAKAAADAKVIADQQAAEAKARDQAESAKPVPAVTPAVALNPAGAWPAPIRTEGNVKPIVGSLVADSPVIEASMRLEIYADIAEQLAGLSDDELTEVKPLILHVIGRVQAQRARHENA